MTDHRCLAGPACRSPHTTADGKHEGAYTTEPDTLCEPCGKHIGAAIRQLPRDWQDLRDALGDQTGNSGAGKIRSTPTPAMPISARKEALMSAITENTVRAAEIVADELNADSPTTSHGRQGWPAREAHTVVKAVRLIEPNIDRLAAAPVAAHVVWNDNGETFHLKDCYEVIEQSGIDIALDLVELHNQTRAELGKTRLRHRYAMPCPHCGGRIGRPNGTTIVDCDRCESAWTEREYKFLAGLIVDERQDMEIVKWLLAEAYWRLDYIQALVTVGNSEPEALALPRAGAIMHEAVAKLIDGHKPADQRVITTDRKTTEARQVDEDNWTWQHEPVYQPPKPKPKRQRTNDVNAPAYSPSSLSTLVDIDADAVLNGNPACPDCNMIHNGTCP